MGPQNTGEKRRGEGRRESFSKKWCHSVVSWILWCLMWLTWRIGGLSVDHLLFLVSVLLYSSRQYVQMYAVCIRRRVP